MIILPSSLSEELHKLRTDGSLIALAEIPEHSIYLARNTKDILWNGKTFSKFWFELEALDEVSTSKIPEIQLIVNNIGGLIEEYVIAYDNFSDCTCIIYIVNSNLLDLSTPAFQRTFQIMKPICSRTTVIFKLSLLNPLLLSYPSWHFHGSICQYKKFKNPLCGYTGPITTCNRTLSDCINRGNEKRFGGQLGLKEEYAVLMEGEIE